MPSGSSIVTFSADEAKMRYREPYVTEGINRKHVGVVARGIYRGFELSPSTSALSILMQASKVGGDHVVVYETTDGYQLSVRRVGDFSVSLAAFAGQTVILAAFATYSAIANTTANLRVYTQAQFDAAAEKDELIVLGRVVVPAAGLIPDANISQEGRMTAGSVSMENVAWTPITKDPAFSYLSSGLPLISAFLVGGDWQVTDAQSALSIGTGDGGKRALQLAAGFLVDTEFDFKSETALPLQKGQQVRITALLKRLFATTGSYELYAEFTRTTGGNVTQTKEIAASAIPTTGYSLHTGVFAAPANAVSARVGFRSKAPGLSGPGAPTLVLSIQSLAAAVVYGLSPQTADGIGVGRASSLVLLNETGPQSPDDSNADVPQITARLEGVFPQVEISRRDGSIAGTPVGLRVPHVVEAGAVRSGPAAATDTEDYPAFLGGVRAGGFSYLLGAGRDKTQNVPRLYGDSTLGMSFVVGAYYDYATGWSKYAGRSLQRLSFGGSGVFASLVHRENATDRKILSFGYGLDETTVVANSEAGNLVTKRGILAIGEEFAGPQTTPSTSFQQIPRILTITPTDASVSAAPAAQFVSRSLNPAATLALPFAIYHARIGGAALLSNAVWDAGEGQFVSSSTAGFPTTNDKYAGILMSDPALPGQMTLVQGDLDLLGGNANGEFQPLEANRALTLYPGNDAMDTPSGAYIRQLRMGRTYGAAYVTSLSPNVPTIFHEENLPGTSNLVKVRRIGRTPAGPVLPAAEELTNGRETFGFSRNLDIDGIGQGKVSVTGKATKFFGWSNAGGSDEYFSIRVRHPSRTVANDPFDTASYTVEAGIDVGVLESNGHQAALIRFNGPNPVGSIVGGAQPWNAAEPNAITSPLIPKAWGTIQFVGGVVSILDGYNIQNLVLDASNLYATISFVYAFANANYAVVIGAEENNSTPVGGTSGEPTARSKLASSFRLYCTVGGSPKDLAIGTQKFSFIVFGRQDANEV